MSTYTSFRRSLLAVFTLASAFTYAQTNAERIKAKWLVENFEVEKDTPQAAQAKKELLGAYLTFDEKELTISRKTEAGESVLKKGEFLLSGNSLTLGKDQAVIILLSEKQLTIKIPNQGVLYLSKL